MLVARFLHEDNGEKGCDFIGIEIFVAAIASRYIQIRKGALLSAFICCLALKWETEREMFCDEQPDPNQKISQHSVFHSVHVN